MKYLWLGITTALFLSGCSVYGDGQAPVVNRNTQYGQQPAFGGQMPPQDGGFGFNPQGGGFNNMAIGGQPPVHPQQPPMRPPVNQPPVNQPLAQLPDIPVNPPQPAGQTQVQAASPYQPAAPTIKAAANANNPVTPPKTPQEPGVIAVREAVKEAPKTAANTPATPPADNKRQALRPGSSDVSIGAPSTPAVADNKAVASAQPAAKAEGETAVSALLKKASGALGKGDLDGAAAFLENAQRLDPKNSKILYDIANIRYHQGRYKEAESMASRAVQSGGNNAMLKKSWSLISNSRNKLGDSQGAVQAATKAASY
ncbi:tetratricopeptide repeat protein [Cardiobacterium valvarum]|nr:tetratricopeptide repeat protein [Cardiobacterium valvarum]